MHAISLKEEESNRIQDLCLCCNTGGHSIVSISSLDLVFVTSMYPYDVQSSST